MGQVTDGEGGLHPGFTCLEPEVPCWALLNIAPPIWFPWDGRQFLPQSLEIESGSISIEATSGFSMKSKQDRSIKIKSLLTDG